MAIKVQGQTVIDDNRGLDDISQIGIGTTANPTEAKLLVDVGTATTALFVTGSEGQLFSVTNELTSGSIFSVNDVSGIPSIDVDADGTVLVAPYSTTEKVGIGTTNPQYKLHVVGDVEVTGTLTNNGSSVGGGGGGGTGVAATITVADESSDTTCFPVFSTAATGDVNPKTGSNLTFNSSDGTLTATAFTGSGANLTNVNAATLDGVDSTSFLRSDTADAKTSGSLTFNDGVALVFGTNTDVTFSHTEDFGSGTNTLNITNDNFFINDSGAARFKLNNGGDLEFKNTSGTTKLKVIGTGATVVGDLYATIFSGIFSGSGASLTSIPNSALTNSSVSYGGVSLALGGSDATPAFNLSDATSYPYTSLTGVSTDIVGDTTPQLGGNLDANSKDITGVNNLNVSGVSTLTGQVSFGNTVTFGDDDKIIMGAGSDLQIYHDGSNSYVHDDGAGKLRLCSNTTQIRNASDNNTYALFSNSGFEVHRDGSKALETVSTGLTVYGTTETQQLKVSGVSTLTNQLEVRSDDGSQGRVDFYCESGNAHYTRVQAAAHSAYSGIATVTLPATSGTLLLSDGSGANLTSLPVPTTITVADESSDTACNVLFTTAATGDLAPKSGTNLTFNSSNGTLTATTFSGSGASLTSIPNGALTNSSVSYGGVSLSLGGSDATPAFNLSDATSYPYTSLTGVSTDIVGDTTPQLGGNLDLNSKDITGTGNLNVTGVVTATTFSGSGANLTSLPVPTTITVADESSDTACNVLFATSATGDLAPKSGTNLTFNSSNGTLTATEFSGGGSGLTGLTGASAATYGSATVAPVITVDANGRITDIGTATISGGGGGGGTGVAATITVADESSDTTCFPIFATGATGDINPKTGSNLTFNSANGTLTASSFAATSFVGVAQSATKVYVDESEDDSVYYNIIFTDETSDEGDKYHGLQVDDGGLRFNPGSNSLAVQNLVGIAQSATKVYVDESEDDDVYYNIIFTDENPDAGDKYHGLQVDDNGLGFNPGANTLYVANVRISNSISNVTNANTKFGFIGTTGFYVETNDIERLSVLESGNIGIGSTIPTTTLDVGGNANVSGVVTATSFSGSGSGLTGLTGASAATYGSATIAPVITVDANGRITTISTATISGGGGGGGGIDVLTAMLFT